MTEVVLRVTWAICGGECRLVARVAVGGSRRKSICMAACAGHADVLARELE